MKHELICALIPGFEMESRKFRHDEGWIVSDICGVWDDQIAAAGYNLKRSETFITVSKSEGSLVYEKVFQHPSELAVWRRFVTSPEPKHLVTCLENGLDLLRVDDRDAVKSTKLQNSPARCIASDSIKRELYIGIDKSTELSVYNFELELIRRLTFSTDKQYDWPRDLAVYEGVLFVCTGERPEKIISIQGITGKELKEYTTPLVDKEYRPYSAAISTGGKVIISWISHITVHAILRDDGKCHLVIPVKHGVSRVAAMNENKITTLDRNTGILQTYDTKDSFTFGNFISTVSRILTEDDCKKLSLYFGLSSAYRERISQSSHPAQCLLQLLEERRFIQPTKVKKLKEGFDFLQRTELIFLAQTYHENRDAHRNSTYENFLCSLSYCLTTAVTEKLCVAFNLSKEAQEAVTSNSAPGLTLLTYLEDNDIIQQSDVQALAKPLKDLELIQALAIIDEYANDVSHTYSTNMPLKKDTSGYLTLQVKSQLFMKTLRKKLLSMCKVASPIPWRKACQWKLWELYVDRRLILTHSEAKVFHEDVDAEFIIQYRDIFIHDKLAIANRIAIEGDPGSGKTMLMFQIANDWCNGTLNGVEIFVPLQLKLVGNMTIPQAIKRCYLPEDTPLTETDIDEILQMNSSNCVMLDGLEEYTGFKENDEGHPTEVDKIMNNDVLTNCKVVLTIRSRYIADLQRCPLLKLIGFGEKERHTYIDKIFKNTIHAQGVKNMLKDSHFLSDLCKIPLLFVLAVHQMRDWDNFHHKDYSRVSPFMKAIIDSLIPFVEAEDLSVGLSVKELAFNGLCRGKQQLSWQKEFAERHIVNLKGWLDSGILVVEQATFSPEDGEVPSLVKRKEDDALGRHAGSNKYGIDSNLEKLVSKVSDAKETERNLNKPDSNQLKIESTDPESSKIYLKNTVKRKISQAAMHVRFMHKIIQEWFAAVHFSNLVDKYDLEQLEQCLRLIDPLDLHYVLRFTCGLNSRSFPVIAKYILRNCRSMDGKFLNPIIDCLCYCFAEHEGDMAQLTTSVRTICNETINITKEDNRLLQGSKVALLKFASTIKVPIAKLVLDNLVMSVTRSDITFNTGITLETISTVREMEVVQLDHELTMKDYLSLIETIVRQEILQKARLQFPSSPPSVSRSMLSGFSQEKKVIWQMGEVCHVLDITTGDWILEKQKESRSVSDHLQLEMNTVKKQIDKLQMQVATLSTMKKDVMFWQQKVAEIDNRLSTISKRGGSTMTKFSADSESFSYLGSAEKKTKEMELPEMSLKRPLPKQTAEWDNPSVTFVEGGNADEKYPRKRRRTLSVSLDYDTESRAENFNMRTFPYREQYFDETGGDLSISKANIHLHVPPGALREGVIISLTVLSDQDLFHTPQVDAPNLCPLVKCGPNGLHFEKPVQLKIPHCGVIPGSGYTAEVFHGDHIEGKAIEWKKSTSNRCEVDSKFFTVHFDHFTFVYPAAIGENIKKRVRAVPLISRMISPTEDAMITFWLCNDTDADYDALMHEELVLHGKTLLDCYEDFLINNSGRSIVSKIKQVNDDWVPHQRERKQRIKHKGIWNGTRRKSIFRLQNKTSSGVAVLKSSLNSKQKGPDPDRVNFALEKRIAEVLQTTNEQGSQPISVRGATETMMESFGTLQVDISGEMNEAACIRIATCFNLPRIVKDDIRRSSTPGLDLLDELIQRGFFSEENVGLLCSFAQKLRMEAVVQLLHNFRRNNATNVSTVIPATLQSYSCS